MKIFEADITNQVSVFLNERLNKISSFEAANQIMFDTSGIKCFFENQTDFESLKGIISSALNCVEEPDRAEYGDFQTNKDLTIKIAAFLKEIGSNPKVIIEPTSGKGNFIIASISTFTCIEKIYAVEIYKPYIWETKFNLLQYFIDNLTAPKPEIEIVHFNVFNFDFKKLAQNHLSDEILIIGNPPWVTNSKLSSLESINLPTKSNFKKHTGLDAITGKGNFDIGEYITLMILDAFQNSNGRLAFLVKNSVIKNLVFDQKQRCYKIADLQKYSIDSKKEFNVSVDASLFTCKFNFESEYFCDEFDLYSNSNSFNKFGWTDDKFVSDVERYKQINEIEGECQFEWRQGLKHDCSAIMEFDRVNGCFLNGLQEKVDLEEDLVYGILKSSDLKAPIIKKTRKFTIVTQKKVGQETDYIKTNFPKTFTYLYHRKHYFDLRKSSIYKGKPPFSIFGIGDYSFKPFKVAISGLYKNFSFNLILPQEGKPIMLDDTCYFIGFDNFELAVLTFILLNHKKSKQFFKSIAFLDAKRTFTKDILMRVDLLKIASHLTDADIKKDITALNQEYKLNMPIIPLEEFIKVIKPLQSIQMGIFA